jgi:hypothetical protein
MGDAAAEVLVNRHRGRWRPATPDEDAAFVAFLSHGTNTNTPYIVERTPGGFTIQDSPGNPKVPIRRAYQVYTDDNQWAVATDEQREAYVLKQADGGVHGDYRVVITPTVGQGNFTATIQRIKPVVRNPREIKPGRPRARARPRPKTKRFSPYGRRARASFADLSVQ